MNGISDGSKTSTKTSIFSANNVRIGRDFTSDGHHFNGTIDEVRIYNRALNVTEIEQLYHHEYTNTTGLVLHIPFKERSGSYANDTSGYGNNGTLYNFDSTSAGYGDTHDSGWTTYGRPLWTDQGKYGYGMRFNGWDDYVDCGNDVSLNTYDFLSVEVWIYQNSLPSGQNGIVEKSITSGYTGWALYQASNEYRFTAAKTDGNLVDVETSAVTGQWVHLVAVKDRSKIYLYKNGVLASSKDFPTDIRSNSKTVKIGKYAYWHEDNMFNGIIDEVRIYNQALTLEEIRAEYEQFK